MRKQMKNISNNSHFLFLLSFAVTALLSAPPTHAQDKDDEIDGIFSWVKPSYVKPLYN